MGRWTIQQESHGDAIGKELPTRVTVRLAVMLKLTSRVVSRDPESLRTVGGISVSVGVSTIKEFNPPSPFYKYIVLSVLHFSFVDGTY